MLTSISMPLPAFLSLSLPSSPFLCLPRLSSSPTVSYRSFCSRSAPDDLPPSSFSPPTKSEILSGEWPENFAILNFEDVCKYLEPGIFKEKAQPHTFLADVMSKIRYTATPDQLLEEVDYCFVDVSGLPVVDKELKCIGVVSKKDRVKASKGLQSTVEEVMTSPAITLSADKTVNDAAILMLRNKIHRIPIVNEANKVIGMVTRTDIFKALESQH